MYNGYMVAQEFKKSRVVPRHKIWWLDFAVSTDTGRACIVSADLVRVSDGKKLSFRGADLIDELLQTICNNGACIVWVWDMSYFGAFCDYFALKYGLPDFKDARKREGCNGAAEPCYSCLYSAGHGVLNFRLTLRRTRKTHEYGGGKIGGLHTVEYRGLRSFFGNETREEVQGVCGLSADCTAENGAELYKSWYISFCDLVGENVESLHYLRKVYTIGGAARRKYLRIKYGKDSLKEYQKEHFQLEKIDDYFRGRKLLLPGMCICPFWSRGELITGDIKKYDVNGLYTDTANKAGDLGAPVECTAEDFFNDHSGAYVYIIVMKDVSAWRKPGMPAVFVNPFHRSAGNHIEIENEIAMFRELFEELQNFYEIDEFTPVKYVRMERFGDPAIVEYNHYFQDEKERATQENLPVHRSINKLFLNSFIGKFSQNTKYIKQVGIYEPQTDSIRFIPGDLVDNWEKGHFHFIRGAYIYVMARVKVMQDMRQIFSDQRRAERHHFYTDTDSIVTDLELPEEWIDEKQTGKYKIEKRYKAFCAINQKVYYARTAEGADEVTAAGVRKGLIVSQIKDKYGDLTEREFYEILRDSNTVFQMDVVQRFSGGAARFTQPVRLSEIDVDKYLQGGF